jgi:4-hydroxy-4-methyl-2-oxoglutarate aldolase
MSENPITVFEQCDTSIVSDAMDEHGLEGVITGLRAAAPTHSAVGRARPVRFERARTNGLTNFPYEMLDAIAPDEVFVLDGVSPELSCWGGQASTLAENSGMAGVVVDGGYRDVPDIREGSFPVFGRQPTPRSGQGRMRVASTDAPVTVDGIRVDVGDIIVADATGVVVVPAKHETAVAEAAADILADEGELSEKVAQGKGIDEIRAEHDTF